MKREDAMQEALSRGLMGASDRAAPGVDLKGKGKKDYSFGYLLRLPIGTYSSNERTLCRKR